jgi:hypothetical protein
MTEQAESLTQDRTDFSLSHVECDPRHHQSVLEVGHTPSSTCSSYSS